VSTETEGQLEGLESEGGPEGQTGFDIETALSANDFIAYESAANKADLARRRHGSAMHGSATDTKSGDTPVPSDTKSATSEKTESAPDEKRTRRQERTSNTRQERNFAQVRSQLAERDREIARLRAEHSDRAQAEYAKTFTEQQSKQRTDKAAVDEAWQTWNQQYAAQREYDRNEDYRQRMEVGKSKFPNFEAVAYSTETPASHVMLDVLRGHKEAASLAYWFGQHPKEAARISEMTQVIAGMTDLQYRALVQRAQTDPQLAGRLSYLAGKVEGEFDRILEKMKAPRAPLPKPTSEVGINPRATQVGDELEDAVARKDYTSFERIMNARDTAAFKSRK